LYHPDYPSNGQDHEGEEEGDEEQEHEPGVPHKGPAFGFSYGPEPLEPKEQEPGAEQQQQRQEGEGQEGGRGLMPPPSWGARSAGTIKVEPGAATAVAAAAEPRFQPLFAIPAHLLDCAPTTERQHKVACASSAAPLISLALHGRLPAPLTHLKHSLHSLPIAATSVPFSAYSNPILPLACLLTCSLVSPLPQILMETARFVKANGGQVEVLLRVKQAANPLFGFLMPGNAMHAYYRWVLECNPQVGTKQQPPVHPPSFSSWLLHTCWPLGKLFGLLTHSRTLPSVICCCLRAAGVGQGCCAGIELSRGGGAAQSGPGLDGCGGGGG
jgi:hypothetical protein